MAAKSPLSELREMNVRRQRETQNPAQEDVGTDSEAADTDTGIDASNIAVQQPINIATDVASNVAGETASAALSAPVPSTPSVGDLRKTALEQLNIRIPAGFNEWLAEEAHRRRREGVTKQSLVTDALEAMIRLRRETPDAEQ